MNTMFVLAVPRIVVGLLVLGHGLQKVAGWFGGPGLSGTATLLDSLRIRRARGWALALGLSEAIGGTAMAAGLFQPLGQIAVATVMLMAIGLIHWWRGLWNANGGAELPLLMATVAVVSAAVPQGISLDAALGISVPAWVTLVFTIGAIMAALYAIATRRPAEAAATRSASPVDVDVDREDVPSAGTRPVRAMRFAAWRRDIRLVR